MRYVWQTYDMCMAIVMGIARQTALQAFELLPTRCWTAVHFHWQSVTRAVGPMLANPACCRGPLAFR